MNLQPLMKSSQSASVLSPLRPKGRSFLRDRYPGVPGSAER
jgi:hypothetical protein